ncbi:MAG: HAMP domain-containing histidine kinase [Oscillospiraceae bacterium]|jgi:signal transduction histidine kinase|nr:HAMP domain-containing histidine kinase [Oscillospiraceae bacterium]MCI1989915.1 HAMP domain-containing histidine kinase [Oscillospiraceae bacterium]MCI2034945.1 HAMP domain-containing histidine kinase [Oscillospiraceae bacterium]
MKKTLFKKYLRITLVVILISFLVISMVILIFVSSYWKTEKRNLLQKNAVNVASLAAGTALSIERNVYELNMNTMQAFTTAFARNIESDIFITNTSGKPVLLAYGSGGSVDASRPVGRAIMNQALNGRYSAEGTLNGMYPTPYYIVGVPIVVDTAKGSAAIGAVFAAYNTDSFNAFRWEIVKVLLFALLAAFLVSFCVVWMFTYRLVQPLRKMASAARSFGEGNFSARVPVTSTDEIGQLAVAFNNMADSLASSESSSRSFIANVSHELKTPMTTIAGFIDGILDGTIPPEKEKHYLNIVSQEVKRLSRLVRTMLDLSRIDSGALKLHPARFDLTNTVLVALLSFEQKIEEKKIEVRGLGDTKSLFVDGDPDMLHQVVYNLIDNAVKFTNEGGYLQIDLSQNGGRTTVGIENSGPGIAPDELPMVFERFYKTDKSRSRDKNGMGLGLYIVKTIVRLHGGDITAGSEPNKFTRFEFWIPQKIEKQRADQPRMVETTADTTDDPKKQRG